MATVYRTTFLATLRTGAGEVALSRTFDLTFVPYPGMSLIGLGLPQFIFGAVPPMAVDEVLFDLATGEFVAYYGDDVPGMFTWDDTLPEAVARDLFNAGFLLDGVDDFLLWRRRYAAGEVAR
jgi:hypothetical protein